MICEILKMTSIESYADHMQAMFVSKYDWECNGLMPEKYI